MDQWRIALRTAVPLMTSKQAAAPRAEPGSIENGEPPWHSKQL